MAQSSSHSSQKRESKKRTWESVLAEAEEFLASQKQKRKPVRKPPVYFFWRNPVTGLRTIRSKYRPRKSSKAPLVVPESEELNELPAEDACPEEYLDETDDTLKDLDHLLSECASFIQPSGQTWAERITNLGLRWASARSKVLKAVLETQYIPAGSQCVICKQAKGCIRCDQCSLKNLLCFSCDEEYHKLNPLHDREIFHEGFFKPVAPTVSLNSNGDLITTVRCFPPKSSSYVDCHCSGLSCELVSSDDKCIVVTAEGRFDFNVSSYQCAKCKRSFSPLELDNVIQLGYWPGTIANTKYIFSQDLFKKWDLLQKRLPGSSESGFLRSLEDLSISKGRVGVINDSAFTTAYKEWKFCSHEVDLLQSKDLMTCPTCSVYQHSVHVDGNAKLYRYKSAGIKKRDSYYGEKFILANDKVDAHLSNVYKNANQSKESSNSQCGESHWQAARNCLKKKKHLDETGLTITGCRHGVAQRAVNMFYGEIYGYAHYLQVNDMISRKVTFFWEDIVCKYWPWLRKKDADTASAMKPALSVMHGKAHSWSCQVLWGGWWQEGAARSTVEEVEQINSYVSRCGSTTKHMCPEGREELLTEHVMAWNQRKIINLPEALSKRYLKVNRDILQHSQELNNLADDLGLDVSSCDLESWTADVIEHARRLDKKSASELTSNGQKAFDLEQKIEYVAFSIIQRLRNINKLADTSKQRHRLRQKISKEKADLAKILEEYNQLPTTSCPVELVDVLLSKFPWALNGENEKLSECNPSDEVRQVTASPITPSRELYCCADDSPAVVFGKIALARKGLCFARAQIALGVQLFRAATRGDYTEYTDDISEDVEVVSDPDEDDWEGTTVDVTYQDDLPLTDQPVSILEGDVCSWMFPAQFCQSSIDGRNGSNACSVISLAVTHAFLTRNDVLPQAGILSSQWIKHLYLCMRLGNALYDNARHSLPHRYLTAAEAAQLFSDYAAVKVHQPCPIRVKDDHPPSTLGNQLAMLIREGKRCAALYIYDNKTVSFLISEDGAILFVDSHSHPPHGAVVIRTSKLTPRFVSCFAEAALLNPSTYGNFTRIEV